MKKRLLPLALAVTLFLPTAALVRADETPPPPPPPPSSDHHMGKHKEPDTELGKVMEKINHAWRQLRKQSADPAKNASSLELVATINEQTEKALKLQPDTTKDQPEADRAKYVKGYDDKMQEFREKLGKLSDAFKANDNTTAVALIKELGSIQRDGHKKYKRPDE
ncbi:MAG: cytochrome b562 [Lacunisphaera sp.]